MARYRVNITVAGLEQVRMVVEKSAYAAAQRARRVVVSDGWSPSDIGRVKAENEEDGHDVWQSGWAS